jgi:hypothetical protein
VGATGNFRLILDIKIYSAWLIVIPEGTAVLLYDPAGPTKLLSGSRYFQARALAS